MRRGYGLRSYLYYPICLLAVNVRTVWLFSFIFRDHILCYSSPCLPWFVIQGYKGQKKTYRDHPVYQIPILAFLPDRISQYSYSLFATASNVLLFQHIDETVNPSIEFISLTWNADNFVSKWFKANGVLLHQILFKLSLCRGKYWHEERPLTCFRINIGDSIQIILVVKHIMYQCIDIDQPISQTQLNWSKFRKKMIYFLYLASGRFPTTWVIPATPLGRRIIADKTFSQLLQLNRRF